MGDYTLTTSLLLLPISLLIYIAPIAFIIWFTTRFLKLQKEQNQILKNISDNLDKLNKWCLTYIRKSIYSFFFYREFLKGILLLIHVCFRYENSRLQKEVARLVIGLTPPFKCNDSTKVIPL